MSSPVLPETPEVQELLKKREELANLESALAESELALAALRAEVYLFERTYLSEVGPLFARLDELKARIAERAAASNGNPEANAAAAEARERANQSAKAAAEADGTEEAQRLAESIRSPRLRELYRAISKQAHPDLVMDAEERARRTKIMAEVNAAYERGDEPELQRILTDLHCSPEAVSGEGVAADLVRVIRRIAQIQRRLVANADELELLRVNPMHQLMEEVRLAKERGVDRVAQIHDHLAAMVDTAMKDLSGNS